MRMIHPAMGNRGSTAYRGGSPLGRLLNRLVVLAFAVIQTILVARILLDLGVLSADWGISATIAAWSDGLAAPVAASRAGCSTAARRRGSARASAKASTR